MVIIPCSMKTLAGVVSGYCDTLLLRAADVTMKERRPLVLVPRECPFSTLHLRNLTAASELGAHIIPPVPAYYNHPKTIEDVNRQVVEKVLSRFRLGQVPEWTGCRDEMGAYHTESSGKLHRYPAGRWHSCLAHRRRQRAYRRGFRL